MNEALIQGVETARAVLTTTPQGQVADAQFVTTVSDLVQQLSDNPAARMTAEEIRNRTRGG